MFLVVLRDTALVWYQALRADQRVDWTTLQAAFMARFKHPDHKSGSTQKDVFNVKQASSSVDTYLAIVLKKISRVKGLPLVTQMNAVIGGLHPENQTNGHPTLVRQHRGYSQMGNNRQIDVAHPQY